MMCRKKAVLALLMLFALALSLFPAPAGAEGGRVLIICGAAQKDADIAYQMKIISNAQMSGFAVSSVGAGKYTKGLYGLFDYVILMSNYEGALPPEVMADLGGFGGQILFIGEGLLEFAQNVPRYNIKYSHSLTGADEIEFDLGHGPERYRLSRPINAKIYSAEGATVLVSLYRNGENSGPWAFKKDNFYYLSQIDDGFLAETALTLILDTFLGKTREAQGIYLKLDYVYPISDLDLVAQIADFLYEQSVPFVYVAMPFYINENSPAAQKYGQLLRYLLSRGGTPIVHCPVFTQMAGGESPQPDVVFEKMNAAIKNLALLETYPLAVEMPEAYLRRADFESFFSCFSHYFAIKGDGKDVYTVSEGTPFPILSEELTEYVRLKNAIREIRVPQELLGTARGARESGDGAAVYPRTAAFYNEAWLLSRNLYADYAISIPSYTGLDNVKEIIAGLKAKSIQFNDFKVGRHSVALGENKIENAFGAVTYNGVLKIEIPQTPEQEDEEGELRRRIAGALKRGNLYVSAFSIFALFILLVAFFIGRRKDKQKFLRRR